MLPAVEIAWMVALRVAALLPAIPAMAVPRAAGEAPRMGRAEEEEEAIFSGVKRGEEESLEVRSLGLGRGGKTRGVGSVNSEKFLKAGAKKT